VAKAQQQQQANCRTQNGAVSVKQVMEELKLSLFGLNDKMLL
jgi:hypothetical protein